jgi:glutamate synthase domain-containing protein 3
MVMIIDALGMHYRELNKQIRTAIVEGETEFVLNKINGQRYIGDGIEARVRIIINGTPGNDLAAFMNGPSIEVFANGQDGIANTMNSGEIIIHGMVGDVIGYGMRGGKLMIKGDVGYRVGIHMKEYKKQVPVIVAGGCAGDFYGEYMAGGIMVLLGIGCSDNKPITGDYLGTGMHGGVIYLRGEVEEHQLGAEVAVLEPDETDMKLITKHVTEWCEHFRYDLDEVMSKPFFKLKAISSRPYGNLYAY